MSDNFNFTRTRTGKDLKLINNGDHVGKVATKSNGDHALVIVSQSPNVLVSITKSITGEIFYIVPFKNS